MHWELAWIDSNLDRYDSHLHAESVKQNIIKRYMLRELQARLKALEPDQCNA